jgi:hypothetical protein
LGHASGYFPAPLADPSLTGRRRRNLNLERTIFVKQVEKRGRTMDRGGKMPNVDFKNRPH